MELVLLLRDCKLLQSGSIELLARRRRRLGVDLAMGGLTEERDQGVQIPFNNYNIPHNLSPNNVFPNHSYIWMPPLAHYVSDPIFPAGVQMPWGECAEECQILN